MNSEEHARPLVPYLRVRKKCTVDLISWPAGAGKTSAAVEDVIADVRNGATVLWLTPTVMLQDATCARLVGAEDTEDRERYLSEDQVDKHNVGLLDNSTSVGWTLSATLTAHFAQPERRGVVILATWQGFLQALKLQQPWEQHRASIRLVVDEVPEVWKTETHYVAGAASSPAWEFYFDTRDANNLHLGSAPGARFWRTSRARKVAGTPEAVTRSMPILANALTAPHLWLATMQKRGKQKTYFSIYLRPEVLTGWQSVEILAAHAEDSLMVKMFSQCGVNFRVNTKYPHRAKLTMDNGECFTVLPLQERRLSKVQFEKDEFLAQELLQRTREAVTRHYARDEHFMFCLPTNVIRVESPPHSERTGVLLAGSNDYREHLAAAFLAALNLEEIHRKELKDSWGLTASEIDTAVSGEPCYQFAMRIKGRDGLKVEGERYLIVVGGMEQAVGLARRLPGATIDRSCVASAEGDYEAGRKGGGQLGSLPEKLSRAHLKRITRLCEWVKRNPHKTPSRRMLASVAEVGAVLGQEPGLFVTNCLRVAEGEEKGSSVFSVSEYRHGFKSG